jgi:hypothetical protein
MLRPPKPLPAWPLAIFAVLHVVCGGTYIGWPPFLPIWPAYPVLFVWFATPLAFVFYFVLKVLKERRQ